MILAGTSQGCLLDTLGVPQGRPRGRQGFRYILDGMNTERILIAYECIGDARWFIDKAATYAKEREVFGRLIGQNQGIQFPITRAYAESEAASVMVDKAAEMFDAGTPCGPDANMAKLLAMLMALTGEMSAIRERLDTHERLAEKKKSRPPRRSTPTRLRRWSIRSG